MRMGGTEMALYRDPVPMMLTKAWAENFRFGRKIGFESLQIERRERIRAMIAKSYPSRTSDERLYSHVQFVCKI